MYLHCSYNIRMVYVNILVVWVYLSAQPISNSISDNANPLQMSNDMDICILYWTSCDKSICWRNHFLRTTTLPYSTTIIWIAIRSWPWISHLLTVHSSSSCMLPRNETVCRQKDKKSLNVDINTLGWTNSADFNLTGGTSVLAVKLCHVFPLVVNQSPTCEMRLKKWHRLCTFL